MACHMDYMWYALIITVLPERILCLTAEVAEDPPPHRPTLEWKTRIMPTWEIMEGYTRLACA